MVASKKCDLAASLQYSNKIGQQMVLLVVDMSLTKLQKRYK